MNDISHEKFQSFYKASPAMKDARTALGVMKKDAFSAMGHMKHRVNRHGMVLCSLISNMHWGDIKICTCAVNEMFYYHLC